MLLCHHIASPMRFLDHWTEQLQTRLRFVHACLGLFMFKISVYIGYIHQYAVLKLIHTADWTRRSEKVYLGNDEQQYKNSSQPG